MKNPYKFNQYQDNQVNTASPEQILLMLYDGAIRFTREAIAGVEENRPDMRRHGITKAMAIVTEFSNTLNHNIGGKIADDLHELYDFMIRELTNANIKNDIDKLKVVEKLLVELRQTWGEAVVINKKEKAITAQPPEEKQVANAQTKNVGNGYPQKTVNEYPEKSANSLPTGYTRFAVSS